MGIVKQLAEKASRKSLMSSASVLGLAAGAVGWSGLAQAASGETGSQLMLLPEHYELMQDGVVVFSLQTGEQLTLNPGQYVILQDGLLLITDELTQASMDTLPVMGSIRAQLTSELQPVRSPDGSVVQASDASPLWSGEGLAPRLFEEVDIQRFELAQNSSETQTQFEGNLGQAAGAAVGGLSLAGLSLLSSLPGTKSDEQATEETTEETTEESSAPAPPPEPEFLSDTMFQALTPSTARAFTGSAGDSFIGYTAANSSAVDPLVDAGRGPGNQAIFDMSAGGNNMLVVGDLAGANTGSFHYTGGSGVEVVSIGTFAAMYGGSVSFNMSAGGNNYLTVGDAAAFVGTLSYAGDTSSDILTFGADFAIVGTVTLDLGSDTAADGVTFQGAIGSSGGSVTIKNFNYNHDTVDVPAGVSASAGEITSTNGDQNLTWTDSGGEHTITFEGIGSAGTGVVATAAQLIADII